MGTALLAVAALGASWTIWRRLREHRIRSNAFVATVHQDSDGRLTARDSTGREYQVSPRQTVASNRILAVNRGDALRLRPTPYGVGNAVEAPATRGCFGASVITILLMICGLCAVARPTCTTDTQSPTLGIVAGIFSYALALGSSELWTIVRALPGSRVITGEVTDVHTYYAGRTNQHLAELRHVHLGVNRLVWSGPLLRRPRVGASMRARISGRPPHRAILATPLMLMSYVVCGLLGGVGVLLALSIAVSGCAEGA